MDIYFECGMGAAGDMLLAALFELLPDKDAFLEKLRALDLPGVEIEAEKSEKCGIIGTHMKVTVFGTDEVSEDVHDHSHTHSVVQDANHNHGSNKSKAKSKSYGYNSIKELIVSLDIPESVKRDVLAVYALLAEAESRVHGSPAEHIHFHEVGTLDALADITGVCLAMHILAPRSVSASPVHVGSGYVRCSHGVLPVPAPATANLLEGIPSYGGDIRGELCTPTGAALLRHFVGEFGSRKVSKVVKIGYGMGTKDFERLNAVRAFQLGGDDGEGDVIAELQCNIDDMTAEEIGFAFDELLKNGALDVFLTSIQMKKNRNGTLLTVLARNSDREQTVREIFRLTTTLGVRVAVKERATLRREQFIRDTEYGAVRGKRSEGYGVIREKIEYDDRAEIARKLGISPRDVTL